MKNLGYEESGQQPYTERYIRTLLGRIHRSREAARTRKRLNVELVIGCL